MRDKKTEDFHPWVGKIRHTNSREMLAHTHTHTVCACVRARLLGIVSYRSQALNIYFHPTGALVGMQDAQRDRVRSPPAGNPAGKPLGLHLGRTAYSNITPKLSAIFRPIGNACHSLNINVKRLGAQLLNVNRLQDSSKRKPITGSKGIIRANYWNGDSR